MDPKHKALTGETQKTTTRAPNTDDVRGERLFAGDDDSDSASEPFSPAEREAVLIVRARDTEPVRIARLGNFRPRGKREEGT